MMKQTPVTKHILNQLESIERYPDMFGSADVVENVYLTYLEVLEVEQIGYLSSVITRRWALWTARNIKNTISSIPLSGQLENPYDVVKHLKNFFDFLKDGW